MSTQSPGTSLEPTPPAPLCLHCLQPFNPLQHYCPRCGAAVGQLTPNIPFVNIRYQCEFWRCLWQKLWSPRPGHIPLRILAAALIGLLAPILLLGLPFALLDRRRRAPRGFDALVTAERRLASPTPPHNGRHPK
jgi:hypothetical protein